MTTSKKKTSSKKESPQKPPPLAPPSAEELDGLNIHQRLHLITSRIGALPKGQSTGEGSKIGNWAFRGIDDVEDALRPELIACRVNAIPTMLSHKITQMGKMMLVEALCKLRFVNIDDPGDSVTVKGLGLGLDTGDKAIGKALSYFTKNVYLTVLHLKGQADVESDDLELGDTTPKYNTGRPMDTIPAGQRAGQKLADQSDEVLQWIVDRWEDKYPDVALGAREILDFRAEVEAQESKEAGEE